MKQIAKLLPALLGLCLFVPSIALSGDSPSKPDVSQKGKMVYACALAKKIRSTHDDPDDFAAPDKDDAYSEATAIASLIGWSKSEKPLPADMGHDIMMDVQKIKMSNLLDDLDRLLDHCQKMNIKN